MDTEGIIARSGRAFKYILDPNADLMSPSQAARLAEAERQRDELKGKLDASEKACREKDALIAQLREQLAAKAEQAPSTPAAKPSSPRRRRNAKKTSPQAKTTDTPDAPAKPARTRKRSRPRKSGPNTRRPQTQDRPKGPEDSPKA
jgi:hypothetical protein